MSRTVAEKLAVIALRHSPTRTTAIVEAKDEIIKRATTAAQNGKLSINMSKTTVQRICACRGLHWFYVWRQVSLILEAEGFKCKVSGGYPDSVFWVRWDHINALNVE